MSTHRREPAYVGILTRLLPGIILGLLVLTGLSAAHVAGWRAEILSTASMGTTAPVGSLVVTRPTTVAAARVGEVVVFHPPGQPRETFVHRVAAVVATPAGSVLTTRGDLSGSVDPWQVRSRDLVGRTVTIVPVAGWLLRMLPWLVAGTLLVVALSTGLHRERRRAIRILGFVLVASAAVWHYRPLVGLELVSYGPNGHGAQASAVPTGILPVRVAAAHASTGAAHADPGQLFTAGARAYTDGRLEIFAQPWLHGWWWLLIATWAVPLLAGLWTRREDPATPL